MKLEQLMEDVPFTLVQGTLETEVEDIIYDSRKAAPGLLFVCIVGTQRDSHDLAADCVAKGVIRWSSSTISTSRPCRTSMSSRWRAAATPWQK